MNIPPNKIRAFTLITDTLIIGLLSYLYLTHSKNALALIIWLFFIFAYFPIFHWIFSRTPGDLVWGLKVVNREGKRPGFWPAIDRFFGVFAKLYILSLALDSLIFLLTLFGSGTLKDVVNEPLDYEKESKTFLVLK